MVASPQHRTRPFRFNAFTLTSLVLALAAATAIGAMIFLGTQVYKQIALLQNNAPLAGQNVVFSERPFTQTQREIFNTLIRLRLNTGSAQDNAVLQGQFGLLNSRIAALSEADALQAMTQTVQANVTVLQDRWASEVKPNITNYVADPTNDTLRNRAVTSLINFEVQMNNLSGQNEIDRKNQAITLNTSNSNVLSEMNQLMSQFIGVAVILTIFIALGGFNIYRFARQREMARRELEKMNVELESRVAHRTRDLQIASDVSRQITTVLDIDQLLREVVRATTARFELYGTFVYRLSQDNTQLVMTAGMGAAEYTPQDVPSIAITATPSLISLAARSHEAVTVDDVTTSPLYLPIRSLPETRSEIAIPMMLGDRLIGVFDLQSRQARRFGKDELRVLQTLAEQIAIAIRNAELYAQAQDARAEAERSNNVKSQFLAAMSHELRTPLNAIINFAKFVGKGYMGPVNEQQTDALNKVMSSANHLLNLINDVLDISKIESGALQLFVEDDVDLREELEAVRAAGQALLEEKPVELRLELPENLPLLTGDKQRIRQVMLNLVSNACKFTDKGHIIIKVQPQEDSVVLSVEDTGAGIAPGQYDRIFEVFRQTEVGLKHGQGTGLGLPISRRLAEAHGGRLWIASNLNKGSTFYVELPIRPPHLNVTVEAVQEA